MPTGAYPERLDLPPDVVSAFFTQLLGGAEWSSIDPAPDEASHAEVMNEPGASGPGPRLVDMDADDVDMLGYRTAPGLQWVPDPAPMHTMAQAYNDWLHDTAWATPRAFLGSASSRFKIPRSPSRRWSVACKISSSGR